jgi:hypothetical protein
MFGYPKLNERQTAISRVMAAACSLGKTASESGNEIPLPEQTALERPSEAADQVGAPVKIQLQLNKLRADAAECAVISRLATDAQKRAFFEKLGAHLSDLASEIEGAFCRPGGRAENIV